MKFTCFLHLKKNPLDTRNLQLSDLWSLVHRYLNNSDSVPFTGNDENYITSIKRLATNISNNQTDEVSLENKLILSIATRLLAELFLQKKIIEHDTICLDANSNQTREWFELAKEYLEEDERNILEDVLLITPENIHLNSFMYEPLIDISDWSLKTLYHNMSNLLSKTPCK